MILTDREIKNSIAAGFITIDPQPGDQFYASTSLDLTLSALIRIFRPETPGTHTTINPTIENYNVMDVLDGLTIRKEIENDGYDLPCKQLILAWAREVIFLHNHGRVAARVEGKSSLARIGLAIHVTAPTIHAGFKGPIQLEIINHGPVPIKLKPGMPICQLIFEQTLGMPDRAYQGQFAGQSPSR